MTTASNHPHYDATLAHAKELGADFRSAMRRKRKLAVSLISAAHVEDFKLEPLIVNTKQAMGFAKLDKADKNQALVFFSALRTISGAWPTLPKDVRDAFLAGEKIYSTLAGEIKAAEKKANEPEPEPKPEPEADAPPAPEAEAPAPEPAPEADANVAAIDAVTAILDGNAEGISEDALAALTRLMVAMDGFRTRAAEAAQAPARKRA